MDFFLAVRMILPALYMRRLMIKRLKNTMDGNSKYDFLVHQYRPISLNRHRSVGIVDKLVL